MEKCGNFWKSCRFSGRIWPDWGNTAWAEIAGLGSIGLSCHNMESKTAIENRGFLMYKKYECLYKHISNSIRNISKWFAAFERVVSLQSNL